MFFLVKQNCSVWYLTLIHQYVKIVMVMLVRGCP